MSSRKNKGFYLHEWLRTAQDMIFYAIIATSLVCGFPISATASDVANAETENLEVSSIDKPLSPDEVDPINKSSDTQSASIQIIEVENIPVYDAPEINIMDTNSNHIDVVALIREEGKRQEEEARRLAEIEKEKAIRAAICYDTDKKSNIPPEMLKELIEIVLDKYGITESKMYGIENAVLEAENYASMNALDILAIMSLESGYGTSYSARNRNNLVGATGKDGLIYYDNPSDCINHFGQFIGDYYISQGRTTLSSIGPKYCPPNPNWANNVQSIKNQYIEVLKTL